MPLPLHTFVAGRTARPDLDFAATAPSLAFAYGCDLFDAGCFFEAHEVWEGLWRAARERGDVDDERTLHALIRLAAAGVKWRAGMTAARERHIEGALSHGRAPLTRGLTPHDLVVATTALRAGVPPRLPPLVSSPSRPP